MDKINISNLVIEVTRRCNMVCDHCLRGEAESLDIERKTIYETLKQVDYISSITFTGGEPSLNVKAIEDTLFICKTMNISVGGFYIATNGLNIKEDFIMTCLSWFAYCDEKDLCSVVVSNDYYHSLQDSYNVELLNGLSFFERRYAQEGQIISLINEGNAYEYGIGERSNHVEEIESIDDFNDAQIYLNCKGEIVIGCDWSYRNQDKYVFCQHNKLAETYEKLSN
jgi:hypothetical protein